jgi:hypothetical protein
MTTEGSEEEEAAAKGKPREAGSPTKAWRREASEMWGSAATTSMRVRLRDGGCAARCVR